MKLLSFSLCNPIQSSAEYLFLKTKYTLRHTVLKYSQYMSFPQDTERRYSRTRCLITHHAMRMHAGVEVQLYVSLTSEVDGDGLSDSQPTRFTPVSSGCEAVLTSELVWNWYESQTRTEFHYDTIHQIRQFCLFQPLRVRCFYIRNWERIFIIMVSVRIWSGARPGQVFVIVITRMFTLFTSW
jgi:hypothetical protein